MSLAVYPGSFDPLTLGHLDIARRARGIWDDVVIAVAHNPEKRYLFSLDQRLDLARSAVAGMGIRVAAVEGLLADYCREVGATAIIKGLRGGSDLDGEAPMAVMNRKLADVETIFLLAGGNQQHIASSLVKDIASHGGDISDLVPSEVAAALATVYAHGGEGETNDD